MCCMRAYCAPSFCSRALSIRKDTTPTATSNVAGRPAGGDDDGAGGDDVGGGGGDVDGMVYGRGHDTNSMAIVMKITRWQGLRWLMIMVVMVAMDIMMGVMMLLIMSTRS